MSRHRLSGSSSAAAAGAGFATAPAAVGEASASQSRPAPAARDRGTATAELAVVLPALVLIAALGVWAVLAVGADLRCIDAAGTGARALARGESPDVVARVVERMAPAGAVVVVGQNGDLVVVEVSATVRLPGPWAGIVPGLRVGDRAVAVAEGSSAGGTGIGSGP